MYLLERDHCFDQLSELLRMATTGLGRTVLISGEAGIGKTSLVEQFVSQHTSTARQTPHRGVFSSSKSAAVDRGTSAPSVR